MSNYKSTRIDDDDLYSILIDEYRILEKCYKGFKNDYIRLVCSSCKQGHNIEHIVALVNKCDEKYKFIEDKIQEYKNNYLVGFFKQKQNIPHIKKFINVLEITTKTLNTVRTNMNGYYAQYCAKYDAEEYCKKIYNRFTVSTCIIAGIGIAIYGYKYFNSLNKY
jgi:hypothetical protein